MMNAIAVESAAPLLSQIGMAKSYCTISAELAELSRIVVL
jgi:hypothetical protein